jgi:DNA polymerase-3 subunit alpha
MPYSLGDRIAKALPPLLYGRDTPLDACLGLDPKYADGYAAASDLRRYYSLDPDVRTVVDMARGLEGLRKSEGVHAAAVVIAPDDLTKFVPLAKKPGGPIVTQYEGHGIEDLGLLKVDFLGLRNLDVITDTLDLIRRRRGIVVDIDKLPLDDSHVYRMLARGESIGVFQLESSSMRGLLHEMAPSNLDDIAACLTLYRPGPMAANMHHDYADRKNGRKAVELFHDDAADILDETFGLMIYQEQVLQIAQRFAGYSLAEADLLRRVIGKKERAEMESERSRFVHRCLMNGYTDTFSTELFDTIESFADYSFNKSHSYAYALITYQTAWLKNHFPVEYMSSLMTSVASSQARLGKYLVEATRMGLTVLLPDINLSVEDFAPKDDQTIIFGLAGIRNIGRDPAGQIVQEREANGPFQDFFSFVRRSRKARNKKILEALISVGAFDGFGHSRRGLSQVCERVLKDEQKRSRVIGRGQTSLFEVPTITEDMGVPSIRWSDREMLGLEKEFLGVYVSGHPMAEYAETVNRYISDDIGSVLELSEDEVGGAVVLAGMVVETEARRTKSKGEPMKTFRLEDMTGSIRCVAFPSVMPKYGHMIVDDSILIISGRTDMDIGEPKLFVDKVTVLQKTFRAGKNVHVSAPSYEAERITRAIQNSTGDGRVIVWMDGKIMTLPETETSSYSTFLEAIGK